MKTRLSFIFILLSSLAIAQSNPEFAEAEIKKIDKESKKITLKHGEIQNLDMPPMTMVFVVKDAALLDAAQVGDKIKFTAIKEGRDFVVTTVKKEK
jgi:Cu(I)/Ag(I) efflux system periplasmic protein CusF